MKRGDRTQICTEGQPRENMGKTWDLHAKETGLRRNQPQLHLELRLRASGAGRDKWLLFEPPGLWDFVMVTLANKYTLSILSPLIKFR